MSGINESVVCHKSMNPKQFCEVYVLDEEGPGGAHHHYKLAAGKYSVDLLFQKGPTGEEGSEDGVIDSAVLGMLIHRLQHFQKGPYASREGAIVLTHLETALLWSDKRIADRTARGVYGKNKA